MAKNFHSRSNSLPSKSHPMAEGVENLLCRLKSSETTSTSVCANLASLRDLHEGINNLIQTPSFQQALSHGVGENWISELLEGSLRVVDLCGFSRDAIYSIKESIQELESSIRRNRGEKVTAGEIDAYVASRKRIVKNVNRCIKNFNQKSRTLQHKDQDRKAVEAILKETQAFDFCVLKSVLVLLAGEKEDCKQKSWSLFSKFTDSSRVHCQETGHEELSFLNNVHKSRKNMDNVSILKQLKAAEMNIQEIEEGLEALFKSLVKTRVSFLNVLSH